MKLTTIFLPDELRERLRQEAFHSRVSMAQLIRSRLDRGSRPRKSTRRGRDPLAEVEGIIRDGRLSSGIDEALYGI